MARTALFVATLAWCSPLPANAETTTTVYTYNRDGALTSITETSDGSSKTTYFGWDNFDAAMGTGTAGNGNLIGIGTMEGDDSIQSLAYDNLDRLVRVTKHPNDPDATAAVYEYYPDELLAASLNANNPFGDGLQHYYDQSRYPQITNLYDRHTGELSSRHRQIRYLEDGTEQMLVRHRKDVDGVYNLTGQTMSGYAYDPYGASLEQELTGTPPARPLYSVRDNPYKYTHEFEDAVSGAYYLRARWYLPGHQTFLQRDPVPNLNRYGYANGNPVMNYDPSGRSAEPSNAGRFFKGLGDQYVGTFTSVLGIVPLVKSFENHAEAWKRHPLAEAFGAVQVLGLVAGVASGFGGGLVKSFLWKTQGFLVGLAQAGQVASSSIQQAHKGASLSQIAWGQAGGFLGGFVGGYVVSGIASVGGRTLRSAYDNFPCCRSDVHEEVAAHNDSTDVRGRGRHQEQPGRDNINQQRRTPAPPSVSSIEPESVHRQFKDVGKNERINEIDDFFERVEEEKAGRDWLSHDNLAELQRQLKRGESFDETKPPIRPNPTMTRFLEELESDGERGRRKSF